MTSRGDNDIRTKNFGGDDIRTIHNVFSGLFNLSIALRMRLWITNDPQPFSLEQQV